MVVVRLLDSTDQRYLLDLVGRKKLLTYPVQGSHLGSSCTNLMPDLVLSCSSNFSIFSLCSKKLVQRPLKLGSQGEEKSSLFNTSICTASYTVASRGL
jgi:hypothetical protein